MIDFQHIMVMGAGAVGGYFGGCIAEKTESEVTLIARGAHLEALKRNGLTIRDKEGDRTVKVRAFNDPTRADVPDLILFTVKSYDTETAIKQIEPVVSERTQILTLQNGIENYPQLVQFFGTGHVMQGFCKIGAGVPEAGVVTHKAFGSITLGEQDGMLTERITEAELLFQKAQIPVRISKNITREVWLKFTWNCILNMLTAIADVTVDKIFEQKEGEQLSYRLFEEIQIIAAEEGVALTDEDGQNIIESSRELKGFETSTYQDRQKGKKMEYEAFTGALVRLAEKHNLSIPHNQTIYALLKVID
ncbi:2-dehydropantoate 2-reductase [Balneolaceae bacterium YR4-1]|uniref:2-dehydropantoate 2-reductase n=1 Tax=Halalkalibaculum roseum TaxID=2709311 RepID=A0A6M1SWW9_9BACT|nr:2-dehydropantoate 2-reductase [Halalkalibaculum roseum]NGP77462.1 2-dehydropantoate 2-reductase [Halalkalibaculum roseum]